MSLLKNGSLQRQEIIIVIKMYWQMEVMPLCITQKDNDPKEQSRQ